VPSKPAQPGLAVRRAALKLLDATLRQGQALDAASNMATLGLPGRDRAFAIAIASEVCRWLIDLDVLIDSATPQVLPDDAKARMVLRLALVQALKLETPHHAVVATALPLVANGPRRLVHGVLGKLLREGAMLPELPSLPAAVVDRWMAAHGAAMVAAAAHALATPPPLDLTLRDPAGDDHPVGTSLLPGHVRLPREGDVAALRGYATGAWWVQDLAASLPARLLGAGEGRTALDIGAAPGGKTMQLATAGWQVTALDASARRLQRLSANLERTGLTAEILREDARALPADRHWDAVLLDAPCSATGIFRRHPDVLHRVEARDIADRAALQAALLDAAARAVADKGTLVYAVCSLEPEEGPEQIAAFLGRTPGWRIDPVLAAELPTGIAPNADGSVSTLPGMLTEAGGLDGFFMARLVRAG
jgi:16S rRNA (cytosine967-C5)-methyltransferase